MQASSCLAIVCMYARVGWGVCVHMLGWGGWLFELDPRRSKKKKKMHKFTQYKPGILYMKVMLTQANYVYVDFNF